MNHQRVGPKEKIKRGQIKLTEARLRIQGHSVREIASELGYMRDSRELSWECPKNVLRLDSSTVVLLTTLRLIVQSCITARIRSSPDRLLEGYSSEDSITRHAPHLVPGRNAKGIAGVCRS